MPLLELVMLLILVFILFSSIRRRSILEFKVAYYEQILKNHGVEIEEVKNMRFRDIFK